MRVADALQQASQRIAAISDTPRLDIEMLIESVSGLSKAQLLARPERELSGPEAMKLEDLIQRRAAGEPVAYLTGRRGFWTLELEVTSDVLVPRPETELLVEWALELLAGHAGARIADLGTGSGAIALALAAELPAAEITAVDLSDAALAVAQRNAQRLGITKVQFRQGSWLAPLAGSYDLIVSNPPYVRVGDPHLASLTHEPDLALTAGGDGLDALRVITGGCGERLKSGGWLLVEHGYDQGAATRELFRQAGFVDIDTRRDLGGQERATGGRKPSV